MKKILTTIATLALLTSAANAAETYKFDPNHTTVNWSANHFGFSNPSGKFTAVDGSLTLDEKNPQKSAVEVTIKIESLNTGLPKFDKHLKSVDFFDAEKFPTAKFVSTSVTLVGKKSAKVKGDLTLHGVTKPVTLEVKLNKIGVNPLSQKQTAGFSATTIIKRSDFGIDYAIPGVADEIKLNIEAESSPAEMIKEIK
jgi:polyisoprenoid-binding protein YceI